MMIIPRRTGASVSRRVSLLDRQWFGHWSAIMASPLRLPPASDLRATLRSFMTRYPRQRLVCRLDPTAGRWSMIHPIEIDDYLEHIVIPVEDPSHGGEDDFLSAHLPEIDHPASMVVLVGRHSMTLYHAHALGDGNTSSRLLFALATGDLTGFANPAGRADMRAVAHEAARELLHRNLSRPVYAPADAQAAEPTRSSRAEAPDAGPSAPDAARPAAAGNRFVRVRVTNDEYRRLMKWRSSQAQDVSLPSVLTSAIAIALHDGGIPVVTSGYHTLIDLRRYLAAPGRQAWGNLSKSLHLDVDVTDPHAVERAVFTLLESNWALASTVYGAGFSAVARAIGPAARRIRGVAVGRVRSAAASAAAGPLALTISIIPSLPGMDLPWVDGTDDHWYVGAGFPMAPGTLGISALRLRTHLDVTATFDAASASPERVRGALAALSDAPRLLAGVAHSDFGVSAGDQP